MQLTLIIIMVEWLQLTRKAGTWIPRLERMVASRGLCSFEKDVLITLIGFVIQPTKVLYCNASCMHNTCN